MIPYKFKGTAYALYSIDKIWERIEIALAASPHALFASQCTLIQLYPIMHSKWCFTSTKCRNGWMEELAGKVHKQGEQ